MVSSLLKLVCGAFVLFVLPTVTLAQSTKVTHIRIQSHWGGLGIPAYHELTITRKGDSFESAGKNVEPRLISNLLDALNSPAKRRIELANLGITSAWLEANAGKGVSESQYFSTAAPNLQALFFSTFKDLTFMRRFVPWIYQGRGTDDYPSVEVEVTTADGKKLVATSEAQHLFMLPWEVVRRGRKVKTYNADIARAVVALMPKEFVNRGRLSGENLDLELSEEVLFEIREKWDLLDAENKAGKYFQALKRNFGVESAGVNSYHNVDFGEEWIDGDPGVLNLQARLKRKGLPRNFTIGIALPFKNGEVAGVDHFLGTIDRYVKLTFSVPWFKKFSRSHPRTTFELRFVGDRSFSKKAMQLFAADMRLKGKESLVKEVEAVQDEVSLLSVGWNYTRDYWLILPNKRIVLWRFDAFGSPVKGKQLSGSAWDCSNYGDHCIGAIISRDGRVIRDR